MSWRGPQYDGEFPSLGHQVVAYIEEYLCHGPGDVVGEPIELDDEFYAFIVKAYRIDPDTGRRVYRRAFLSRAKGRAKSEIAGMLVCAEALFPVRFDGWDASGEPVGRPVKSPYIRCLATEEGQSGNTYDNVTTMLEYLIENHGDEFPGIDIGKSAQSSSRIILHHQRGEVTPSTASSAAKDGGKETFAVFLPSTKPICTCCRSCGVCTARCDATCGSVRKPSRGVLRRRRCTSRARTRWRRLRTRTSRRSKRAGCGMRMLPAFSSTTGRQRTASTSRTGTLCSLD